MENKWLGIGLAAATAFLVFGGSKTTTTTNTNNTPPNPPAPDTTTPGGGPSLYDPTGPISGIPGITSESSPIRDWKRPEWSTWYKELSGVYDQLTALQMVWNAWRSMPYADYIRDPKILWANLATWRQKDIAGIGSFTFPITATASPVYDTWTNWWNNIPAWGCNEWQTWFTALENTYGLEPAKNKFISAWTYTDNWATGSNAWDCSQTCDFINFFRTKGIDVADFGMETICNLIQVPYNLSVAAAGATQGISATINTAANIAPLIIIGAGAALLYKQYQSVKNG